MSDVVVLRMMDGSDILAFLIEEREDSYQVEHPHTIKIDARYGVMMIPYCQLTDVFVYDIPKHKIEFCAPASRPIVYRFLDAIDSLEASLIANILEDESYTDQLEAGIRHSNYVSGNDTKH